MNISALDHYGYIFLMSSKLDHYDYCSCSGRACSAQTRRDYCSCSGRACSAQTCSGRVYSANYSENLSNEYHLGGN